MTVSDKSKYLALSGGVGGAKLVLGLSGLLDPSRLSVVANTGDDFVHLGLSICPDIDTVLYTLADWNNKELGWGQVNESWNFLDALKRLDGEGWFNLGDRDLATHIIRSELLRQGRSLSEVVDYLCERMHIRHKVMPMTDDAVSTIVKLRDGGELSFQHYFVRDKCEPVVTGFEFAGMSSASPSPSFKATLESGVDHVIICPSNPFVSIDPILKMPGVVSAIRGRLPVVVVSNIVGGEAIKGPAAKMMTELGMPRTALGVAQHYTRQYDGLISGFVLDEQDAHLEAEIRALGLATIVTNTVMLTLHDKTELAANVLEFAATLTP